MDEITIDDKKYISSKQAAKLTGYAKDSVGQLCREGRVSARLVGRSWYVLESAIQDHGRGEGAEPVEKSSKMAPIQESEINLVTKATWATPRYESAVHENLPTVNRSYEEQKRSEQDELMRLEIERKEEQQRVREQLEHDEKFEMEREQIAFNALQQKENEERELHIAKEEGFHDTTYTSAGWEQLRSASIVRREQKQEDEYENQQGSINRNTKQETQKHVFEDEYASDSSTTVEEPKRQPYHGGHTSIPSVKTKIIYRAIQAICIIIAFISVVVATLNTGVFDKYLTSDSRAHQISGIITIEK